MSSFPSIAFRVDRLLKERVFFSLSGPKADVFKGPFLLPATAKRLSLPLSSLTPSLTFLEAELLKENGALRGLADLPTL